VTGRYAPPKAKVEDVMAERALLWGPTRWLSCGFTAAMLVVAVGIQERLLADVSPVAALIALLLTALLSLWPLRALRTRRSSSAPLWWNLLIVAVTAVMVAGGLLENDVALFVGFTPPLLCFALIAGACWAIERRHGVRFYSTTNGFVVQDARP
jgi:hypothetical protein